MNEIIAYRVGENSAIIKPLSVNRDWMDETYKAHAYKCFPVSLTNQLGWGLSFPEDITFIWDGISDHSADHVKILEGNKYCSPARGNATISFETGILLKTEEDTTIVIMPVPNQFIDGATAFTASISTSFFSAPLPAAWRITRANVPITIKANTPFISIVPMSLKNINNSSIIFRNPSTMEKMPFNGEEYSKKIREINLSGGWSNFYRDGVDHLGNKIGTHEVKSIRLSVIEENTDV